MGTGCRGTHWFRCLHCKHDMVLFPHCGHDENFSPQTPVFHNAGSMAFRIGIIAMDVL